MESRATAGDEWGDPVRVGEYLRREIPFRDHAEALLVESLPATVERVLDLGTGDGRLLAVVRDRHPGCHCVGIDVSEPMLDRARDRFAGDQLCALLQGDLAEPLPATGPFDAIVSGLAIHHLDDGRKKQLFVEAHALLRAGGVFANLDLAASPTAELHRRFRQAIGRTQDDPSDQLAELTDQIGWLRQAGFADVDCLFKWRELALIVGARRGRQQSPGCP